MTLRLDNKTRYFTPVALALSALLFVIAGISQYNYNPESPDKKIKDQEEKLWQETVQSKTTQIYKKYINKQDKNVNTQELIEQDNALFNQTKNAQSLQAYENYFNNCVVCKYKSYANKKIKLSKEIEQNFKFHIKVKNLSRGKKGYAINDIKELVTLFPGDVRISQWQQIVVNSYIKLAKKKQLQPKKAQIYLKKALELSHEFELNKLKNTVERKLEKISAQALKLKKLKLQLVKKNSYKHSLS